ncbi:MFS transporter [Burkholderiaceae bacterium DAT-1]|nr:MFS transporter [Burkholderiaceae bacterium DAT-1]
MKDVPRHLLYFALFFILYELTVYLSNDMIMPAMIAVIRDYHGHERHIGQSLSLYILGGSLLQAFLGPLCQQIGRKRVMLGGCVFFLLATAIVPFASSIDQFLIARFFQGMGSCFIFIGYASIHETLEDSAAIKLTTLLSNIAIFAPLAGPLAGSAILLHSPWQSIFAVAFVLALIAMVGIWLYMPVEQDLPRPALQLRDVVAGYRTILGSQRFMTGILLAGITITPLTAWIGLSPALIMTGLHQDQSTYLLCQAVIFTGFIASTLLIQRMGDVLPIERLLTTGSSIAAIGMLISAALSGSLPGFLTGMTLFAGGFGLFNGALIRVAMTAPECNMSMTAAAMSLLYCIYIAIGLEAYNLIGDHTGFSLGAFAGCNLVVAVVAWVGIRYFIHQGHVAPEAAIPAPQGS